MSCIAAHLGIRRVRVRVRVRVTPRDQKGKGFAFGVAARYRVYYGWYV